MPEPAGSSLEFSTQKVLKECSLRHGLSWDLLGYTPTMNTPYHHQVIFCLKAGTSGPAVEAFLTDAERILRTIPGVRNFQVLKQVSPKNDYDFGFIMEFAHRGDYRAYDAHPDHTAFVQGRWVPEVSRFLEIDFES
jgi:hypothetical protein